MTTNLEHLARYTSIEEQYPGCSPYRPEDPIVEICRLKEEIEALRTDRDRWMRAAKVLWREITEGS